MLAEDTGCDVDNKSKPQWHEPTFTKQFIYEMVLNDYPIPPSHPVISCFMFLCSQYKEWHNNVRGLTL